MMYYCQFVIIKYSSIEHLIMNTRINLNEIGYLLSYLPYLRRLSINYLVGADYQQININTIQ